MLKQTKCQLCGQPFFCNNGMWFTTCDCARTRPNELRQTLPTVTADDWDYEVFHLDCLKTLAAAYEQEHDFENDEDESATRELLAEVRALHTRLMDALGPRPPAPEPVPADPDIPF